MRQQNIFDVINVNIYAVSEDLHTLMSQVTNMQQEIVALSLMFKAPEQPNAHGDEGAEGVSSEHKK